MEAELHSRSGSDRPAMWAVGERASADRRYKDAMLGQSVHRPPQQYPQHQRPAEGKRGAGIIGGNGQRESYRETVVPSLCAVAVGSARLHMPQVCLVKRRFPLRYHVDPRFRDKQTNEQPENDRKLAAGGAQGTHP